jgi:hypothetical protein
VTGGDQLEEEAIVGDITADLRVDPDRPEDLTGRRLAPCSGPIDEPRQTVQVGDRGARL